MNALLGIAEKYPIDAISYLVILLPILIGLIRYSYLRQESRIFWIYFICVFAKESVALYTSLNGISNLYLHNTQSIIDITILGIAYHIGLNEAKLRQYLVVLLGSCLLIATIFFRITIISPINQIAGKVFCISAALLFFNDTLKGLRVVSLSRHAMFWLSSGVLLYGAGTFLIALFGQLLMSNSTPEDTFDLFWNIQQFIYVAFCLLASVGFWVSRYEK
ncbi:hypothetical protein GCM10028805_33710 [Spirosoma harenae]